MKKLSLVIFICMYPILVFSQPELDNSRYKLANSYENLGDTKNAARIYKELYDLDKNSDELYEDIYRTFSQNNSLADLLTITRERFFLKPNNFLLTLRFADILYRNNLKDSSNFYFDIAIKQNPQKSGNYLAVAEAQAGLTLYQNAINTIIQGKKYFVSNSEFSDVLGKYYAKISKNEESILSFIDYVTENPNQVNYVINQLSFFTESDTFNKTCISILKNKIEGQVAINELTQIIIWLYSEIQDFENAFTYVVRNDKATNSNGSKIYSYANKMYQESKYDESLRTYKYIIDNYEKNNPLNQSSIYGYVNSLEKKYKSCKIISLKDANDLIDRYKQIVSDNKGSFVAGESLVKLSDITFKVLKNYDKALEYLQIILDEYPKSKSIFEANLKLGDIYLFLGDTSKAAIYYNKVISEKSSGLNYATKYKEEATLKINMLLYYQCRFDEALAGFTEISNNPKLDITNDAIEKLYLIQDNLNQIPEALKHFSKGDVYYIQNKYIDALSEYQLCFNLSKKENIGVDALIKKSDIFLELNQIDSALFILKFIKIEFPNSQNLDLIYFKSGEIYEEKFNNKNEAISNYMQILTEFPKSTLINKSRQKIRNLRGDKN